MLIGKGFIRFGKCVVKAGKDVVRPGRRYDNMDHMEKLFSPTTSFKQHRDY